MTLTTRMESAEEYLKGLVMTEIENHSKGEFLAMLKAKVRNFP